MFILPELYYFNVDARLLIFHLWENPPIWVFLVHKKNINFSANTFLRTLSAFPDFDSELSSYTLEFVWGGFFVLFKFMSWIYIIPCFGITHYGGAQFKGV